MHDVSPISEHNTLPYLMKVNSSHPVTLYLSQLNSYESKRTQFSKLKIAAESFGAKDPYEGNWENLNRDAILWLKTKYQAEGKSSNTINATLAAIKGVLKEYAIKKMFSQDELSNILLIKSIKRTDVSQGPLVPTDHIKLMLLDYDTPRGARNNLVVGLLYGCGLRRSEVTSLKVNDVKKSPDGEFLRVRGKGRKFRDVPMPQRVSDLLKEWVQGYVVDKTGPLITRITKGDHVTNKPISGYSIYNIIKERAQSMDVTPHCLRGSFITHLLDGGAPIDTVADWVGHASIDTTRLYDRSRKKRVFSLASSVQF